MDIRQRIDFHTSKTHGGKQVSSALILLVGVTVYVVTYVTVSLAMLFLLTWGLMAIINAFDALPFEYTWKSIFLVSLGLFIVKTIFSIGGGKQSQ